MFKVKHLNENVDFKIDTEDWTLGISIRHFDNLMYNSIDWVVQILCFAIRYKKFKEHRNE